MFYKPPESLSGEPYKPKPADIWAFAVSLYSYLTLEFPFDADNEAEFNEKLLKTDPIYPATISPKLKDLFSLIFQKDPS